MQASLGRTAQVKAPPRSKAPALIEFFRHHGAWAPGVRLFRRLQFKGKAALISLVFILPLAGVSTALWHAKQDVIEFAGKERAGAAAMERLAHVYNELTNTRNATRAMLGGYDAAADYASHRAAVDKALADMDAHVNASGDPLALRASLDKVRSEWVKTASFQRGVDDQGRTVFGPVVESVHELLNRIGDDSNLVLDPDVDSFYLINAMVLSMPKLMEDTGQLWGWSTYAAGKGPLDKKHLGKFNVWFATAGSGITDMRDYIGRAQKANPSLVSRVDLEPLKKVEAFQKLAQGAVVDGNEIAAEALYVAGRDAVTALDGFYDSTLPAIDGLLEARIEAAHRELVLLSALVLVFLAVGAYLFHSFFLVTQGGCEKCRSTSRP